MLTARRSGRDEDREWEAFVASHPCGHFLQSAGWGRFRERWGWRADRVVVTDDEGAIVSGAQLLVRTSRAGAVVYVPRGPVSLAEDAAWPALRSAMRTVVRGTLVVRLEPHWPDEAALRDRLRSEALRPAPAVQPPSTVVIDLEPGEDALLSAMKQKWRYNVRLAERRGVAVRLGGEGDLDDFGRLMAETAARDGFGARPGTYYADAWRALREHARLYVAELEGRTLAGILVVQFGTTATYLYGASSSEGRAHMPNHLLQWEAIRRARRDGCRRYDLWGVPDRIGRAVSAGAAPDDVAPGTGGLWGVWGFKRGFGGRVWRSVGAWDDVRAPLRYWIGARLLPRLRRGRASEP